MPPALTCLGHEVVLPVLADLQQGPAPRLTLTHLHFDLKLLVVQSVAGSGGQLCHPVRSRCGSYLLALGLVAKP